MNRKKLLISNILVYGVGGVMSKLIPLIMLPIITRLLPNSFYFGLNDITSSIISLFSALAIMGMYDAMFRLFFDKDDKNYKKEICSSAFVFVLAVAFIIFVLLLIFNNQISKLFFNDVKYGNLVMMSAVSVLISATNSIVSAPTRMENKKVTFLLINTISPIISYSISIPLILNGYYVLALPLAAIISAGIIELTFLILNKKHFSFKCVKWEHIKSMLKIATPLLFNFLIYWIFNSCDKVMIINMLGIQSEGVYSIASKIGQISNLIYVAFAGGWQYFAFSIMKDEDNVKVISKVFEIMLLITLVSTLAITSISKIATEILFPEEYWDAYICMPYLYMAPLLLSLYQIGANQLLVIKKTWPNIIMLTFGAIINIVMNLVLIPTIGIEGASISTFSGYLFSILLCVVILLRMKLLKMNKKSLIMIVLFLVLFLVMRINEFSWLFMNLLIVVLYLLTVVLIYRKDIKKLRNKQKGDDVL